MEIWRDFPYNNVLFGLVSYDPRETTKNHPASPIHRPGGDLSGKGVVGPKQSSHRSSVALLHARTGEGANISRRCNSLNS